MMDDKLSKMIEQLAKTVPVDDISDADIDAEVIELLSYKDKELSQAIEVNEIIEVL